MPYRYDSSKRAMTPRSVGRGAGDPVLDCCGGCSRSAPPGRVCAVSRGHERLVVLGMGMGGALGLEVVLTAAQKGVSLRAACDEIVLGGRQLLLVGRCRIRWFGGLGLGLWVVFVLVGCSVWSLAVPGM